MSADARLVFALGARLCMSAAAVERLSLREVLGWVEFFSGEATPDVDADALDPHTVSRTALKAMFHHG